MQRKIPISTERSPEEQARYENARNRAQALRRFYEHLILFAIVNLGLFLIDFFTSPGSYWFYWVTLGWGIALAIHAYRVFFANRVLTDEWEEKKTREYMEKDK